MSQNFEKIKKNSIIFKFIFFFKRKFQFKKNFFEDFRAKIKHIKKAKSLALSVFPYFSEDVAFFLWSRDRRFFIFLIFDPLML